ncbi:MAG: FAD-binding oxidoreductase, partial [Longimicrobiales bacterium]
GDAVQLLVGSEGTLGLITAATLDLAPLPESRVLLLTAAREPRHLLTLVERARELEASACEFFGRRFVELARLEDDPRVGPMARDAYALVLVELDGPSSAVDDALASMQQTVRELGRTGHVARTRTQREELWGIRHAASPVISRVAEEGRVSMQFIEDSVVPPVRLPDYLGGLDEILAEVGTDAVVFGHAGDGNVHVNPLVDVEDPEWRERVGQILERTVDLVARLGGTLAGEHGDGRVRAPFLDRIWSEEAVRCFRTVKETLDPDCLLNPGVILPVEGQASLSALYGAPGRH